MAPRARTVPALFALLLAACRPPSPSGEVADVAGCDQPMATLFEGGTVLTMFDPQPRTDRLLIRDGEVLAIDRRGVAEAEIPPACVRTVDLGGATLMPGFIDGHVHVRELGMDAAKVDLVGAEDVDEIVRRLKLAHPDPLPGVWIVGQGWDEGAFATGGYPDRAALDAAFPENPVALESLHGFAGFYNGAALEAAGVDARSEDPKGGTILRRDDGDPSGVMLALAQAMVNDEVPPPSPAQRQAAILEGLQILATAGVTSVHEAGMSAEDVAAFMALAGAGRLPIRVYGLLDGNDATQMEYWFQRGPLEHPSGRLAIRGIKVFYDGSLGSRTALLAGPYADAPELAAPAERISPARIGELAEMAALEGFQMAVHAIGDEANRRVLGVYRDALMGGGGDHRWRIEHAQVVSPDFFAEAAAMHVVVSMQPSHAVGDSAWAEDRLGAERVQRAYAWRSMLDAGVPLILNSDLPGEPWTPAQTLYFAVTRRKLDGSPAGGWYPEQAVSTEEALRAMTVTPAWAAFQENEIGRLAPGLRADFVVLDANPLDLEPAALKDLQVRETWVDGQRVWAGGRLRGGAHP